MLDDFKKIDLSVELSESTLEQSLIFLEATVFPWATGLAPARAEEPMQLTEHLTPAIPMIRIAEHSAI